MQPGLAKVVSDVLSAAARYRRSILYTVANLREEAMWLKSATDARDMKATAADLNSHFNRLTS